MMIQRGLLEARADLDLLAIKLRFFVKLPYYLRVAEKFIHYSHLLVYGIFFFFLVENIYSYII